jgi:N-methylhydantoinase B
MSASTRIDPVTFEVLSHRLWAINDEQATIAARVSGSPAVFEAFDFNSSLLSRDGQGLFAGIYIVHHAVSVDIFVERIREQWAPDEIAEGDMFFTNDPWAGAMHANDGILATPIFWDGEIVCWSGIVMHESDVGSPVPGSFVVGATDRFGEAPLMSPIKMVERFELRRDIEAAFLRNHRTAELNALNLRARMAALRITHRRIHEVIEKYGVETFLQCQTEILDYVERVTRRRLAQMPDGDWFEHTYLDHDGNSNAFYEVRCRLTKEADHLLFDFRGTAAQAPGAINCTRSGLEAGVLGVLLLFLCHDLPWSAGALRRVFTIEAEEGTVNNAAHPAATSMGSVMGTWATQTAASNAVAKMLLASAEQRDEAQASWQPGVNAVIVAGLDRNGAPAAGPLMEAIGGGGGARTFADGIDTGGMLQSMSATITNVELMESRYPLLYVFRRERPDSCGHGRFRGGMGLEFAITPHKNAIPLDDIVFATAVSQPEGHGIAGGTPSAMASNVVVRGSDVREQFAAQRIPASADEISGRQTEVLQAKQATRIDAEDCHVSVVSGGGGYGDPLRRDVERVALDLARGNISAETCRDVYGVVVDGDRVDVDATQRLRDELRSGRLARSRPVGGGARSTVGGGVVLHPVSDTVEAVEAQGRRLLRCTVCDTELAAYGEDLKQGLVVEDLEVAALGALNADHAALGVIARRFCCPGCATAVAVDVQFADEPLLPEATLRSPGRPRHDLPGSEGLWT